MKQEEFNNLMEEYERTHESWILQFARDVYMVGTLLGVAYLIFKTLI